MKSSYPALQGAIAVAISWISARLGILFFPVVILMLMMVIDYITGMPASQKEAIEHPEDPALELGLESTDVAGILTELAARVKALEEGGSSNG